MGTSKNIFNQRSSPLIKKIKLIFISLIIISVISVAAVNVYINSYINFPIIKKKEISNFTKETPVSLLRDYPASWTYDFENGWNAERTRCHWSKRNINAKKWRFAQLQSEFSAEVINDPQRKGNKVMKFEWRRGEGEECDGNTQKKSMIYGEWRNYSENEEFWSLDIYFPEKYMQKDSEPEIIIQWHDHPDRFEFHKEPSLTLHQVNDEIIVTWTYDKRKYTPPQFKNWDRKSKNLGNTPKNHWVNYEFHIIWDPFGNGLLKVWQDKVLVIDEKNIPIGYNDDHSHYIGIGIYNYTSHSDYKKRILYMDNVKQAVISPH